MLDQGKVLATHLGDADRPDIGTGDCRGPDQIVVVVSIDRVWGRDRDPVLAVPVLDQRPLPILTTDADISDADRPGIASRDDSDAVQGARWPLHRRLRALRAFRGGRRGLRGYGRSESGRRRQ